MRYYILAVAALMLCIPFIGIIADGSDADASHPVPTADFSYEFGLKTYTTSSHADVLVLNDLDDDDQQLAFFNESLYVSNNRHELSVASSYLPDWIVFSFPNSASTVITIIPGSVCDDIFWIKFNTTGSTTLLMIFNIKVEDSGSVVPAGDENSYTLNFDVGEGSYVSSIVKHSAESQVSFDISEITSSKDGYKFKGWSLDEDGESVLTGTYTMRALGDGHSFSSTVYAIWEKDNSGLLIPTLYDGIIELVNNPLVLLCSVGGIFGLAFFIRGRQM